MKFLGATPTGQLVNFVRLGLAIVALATIVVSVVFVGIMLAVPGDMSQHSVRLYVAAALFGGGVLLLLFAASFQIQSHPFLLPDVVYKALEGNASPAAIESLIKALEAHVGAAGFFNRIGFSGLSLGTIASAFLILVLGLFARYLEVVDTQQFGAFMDLSKLLLGAFVGSFASRALPQRHLESKSK